MDNGFQGKSGQQVPEMTDEIVKGISDRYIELFENITGSKFDKAEASDVASRIDKNVSEYLKTIWELHVTNIPAVSFPTVEGWQFSSQLSLFAVYFSILSKKISIICFCIINYT